MEEPPVFVARLKLFDSDGRMKMKNIVFDLGGVLIDWNPRYLYRKIFSSETDIENFLTEVCNHSWNEKQDAGRSFAAGVQELVEKFPQFREQIHAYDQRWEEMLSGPIPETVTILQTLSQRKTHRLLGLSNWSRDKFPVAEKNYPFLELFEGIVVSGRIHMKKPDADIFEYLCRQYDVRPEESLFIDDSLPNIETARRLGFQTIHFQSAADLKDRLRALQILD